MELNNLIEMSQKNIFNLTVEQLLLIYESNRTFIQDIIQDRLIDSEHCFNREKLSLLKENGIKITDYEYGCWCYCYIDFEDEYDNMSFALEQHIKSYSSTEDMIEKAKYLERLTNIKEKCYTYSDRYYKFSDKLEKFKKEIWEQFCQEEFFAGYKFIERMTEDDYVEYFLESQDIISDLYLDKENYCLLRLSNVC